MSANDHNSHTCMYQQMTNLYSLDTWKVPLYIGNYTAIYNRSITAACCASPIQNQSSRPDACVLATKNQQKDGMQKQTQIASDPAVFVFV